VVDFHGRFAWYELMTTDVPGAKAFYTKVIGWAAWDAPAPGSPYTVAAAGNAAVGGLMALPEQARNFGARPGWIGYVAVDDVDAAAERVERLGGVLHVPPTDVPNISRFAVFADPQAASLALFKRQNPGRREPVEPGTPGRVGWHELLAADLEPALAFYSALFDWQKADADVGEGGTYQLFSAGGEIIGGLLTKPPTMPTPFWLYYFNVGDIDAAAGRVKAAGGEVSFGPLELPGGSWLAQCIDPQGVVFALEGTRRRSPVGYFERIGPRDPLDPRSRRWSW